MSTKKKIASKSTKPIRSDDGPTEFFPKRGSGKRGASVIPMIAGNGAKQKAAKAATKAASNKPVKATTKRRLSGLSAAAQVLAEARKAMTCQEIVTAMLKRGLWKTEGKTPAATLSAAVHREIKAMGKASRFWKASRGKFVVAKGGK